LWFGFAIATRGMITVSSCNILESWPALPQLLGFRKLIYRNNALPGGPLGVFSFALNHRKLVPLWRMVIKASHQPSDASPGLLSVDLTVLMKLCCCSVASVCFNGHSPGEPGLAGVY